MSLLCVLFALAGCAQQPAEPVALEPQSPAPAKLVRSVSLDHDEKSWLSTLKSSSSYRSLQSDTSLEREAASGNVKDLARFVNQNLTSILAVLRVTGDEELLEKTYQVMQKARSTLRDSNGDGYLNWRYLERTGDPEEVPYYGKDTHVMEELMAHAIVAQAAYAFELNRHVDAKYGAAASFWENYLKHHFEAKWRKRTGKRSGYPIIDKELFHPYTNATRYYLYMFKLTGEQAYKTELERRLRIIERHLIADDGTFVWTHQVGEVVQRRGGTLGWGYQATGYAGEAIGALADLGLEGALSETTMRTLARTLAYKILDDRSDRSLPGDVGQGRTRSFYIPWLGRSATLRAPGYPRTYPGMFLARPFSLLAPWDGSGEVAAKSSSYHRLSPGLPHAPAGVILVRLLDP